MRLKIYPGQLNNWNYSFRFRKWNFSIVIWERFSEYDLQPRWFESRRKHEKHLILYSTCKSLYDYHLWSEFLPFFFSKWKRNESRAFCDVLMTDTPICVLVFKLWAVILIISYRISNLVFKLKKLWWWQIGDVQNSPT